MIKYHIPVLPVETLEILELKKNGVYVDATIGGGGHTQLILDKLGDQCTIIGIDRDIDAIEECLERFSENDNVILANENFDNIDIVVKKAGFDHVDGIIADFGVSSWQLDKGERGFSFSKDAYLDMRMNQNDELTAKDVINDLSAEELQNIFSKYGEERYSKRIAREIIKKRSIKHIETTIELAEIIKKAVPKSKEKIHPATRVFQALRIYVNDELNKIDLFLEKSIELLKPGGRICCISFHSLEDRRVKKFFKKNTLECICPTEQPICTCNHKPKLQLINRKPIIAKDEEIKNNIRSRSAKLRGAIKR